MLGGGGEGVRPQVWALTMMPRWSPVKGVLLGAALVLLACQGSPDAEPTPDTPTVIPEVQDRGAAASVSTPAPETPSPQTRPITLTEKPSAPPGPLSNLRPTIPEGWRSPLVIAFSADAPASTILRSDGPVYVSWAMINDGLAPASRFFVDLYLDGVPVERWSAQELVRADDIIVQGWSDLLVRARLTPGEHELRLVVDSTNLVSESDESDNSHTLTFNWPQGSESARPPTAPSRLPNLAPFTPPGWSSPIRIAEPSGGEALTVEVAYRNEGLSSIGQLVQVYLYVDGILAAKFRERDLISGEGVLTPPWSGLTQVIPLTPGPHTFTLTTGPDRPSPGDGRDGQHVLRPDGLGGVGRDVYDRIARGHPAGRLRCPHSARMGRHHRGHFVQGEARLNRPSPDIRPGLRPLGAAQPGEPGPQSAVQRGARPGRPGGGTLEPPVTGRRRR